MPKECPRLPGDRDWTLFGGIRIPAEYPSISRFRHRAISAAVILQQELPGLEVANWNGIGIPRIAQ
jgi:hypothetical protein